MIKLLPFLLFFVFFHSPASTQLLPPFFGTQGQWLLLQASIGISAMHMQLLYDNKVIMFDRTDFGPSNLSLPVGRCRDDPYEIVLKRDCTAHSVIYDITTNTFRPLMIQTDAWCSSGSVLPDGTLVQTGGYNDGDHVIRTFAPCMDNHCDWIEHPNYLVDRRWYATNQILPDGRIIIVGGRRLFTYEFYPNPSHVRPFWLELLRQTRDGPDENNLYPFLHLMPDGNLFIFANTRSILFDYNQDRVVREFPPVPGNDPRNYPSSGSSVMFPLDENRGAIEVEILVCGGAPRGSFRQAINGVFQTAISSCGRLRVTDLNPVWVMETMPIPRVMGDILLLPTGDVIIINGVRLGTAGWELGREPVMTPIIYRPYGRPDWRFSIMAPASRPRMYHSSAILLPDGRVLVGGSNPHIFYNFTGVEYPTDLSLEAFSPPYLSTEYNPIRPHILSLDKILGYGQTFLVRFSVENFVIDQRLLSVRIIAPSFTTHAFAMNQRMVVLRINGVIGESSATYTMTAVGPSTATVAPAGYYLLFVVHAGIPSPGAWVKIQ